MTIDAFKSQVKKMEMEYNCIMRVVEGPGVGLIGLSSRSKFEPCLIIAEGKQEYFYITEREEFGKCLKKEFQIVQKN